MKSAPRQEGLAERLELSAVHVYLTSVERYAGHSTRIHGSTVRPLVVHPDERGRLFEVLRADDAEFIRFGQVYVTTAHPGIVKGWHRHRLQTDFFCLIEGRSRFVLYDPRADSPTRGQIDVIECDGDRPQLIIIPPLVYHGFKNVGDCEVVCLNCPTEPYDTADPDEERVDPFANDIPYDWGRDGEESP